MLCLLVGVRVLISVMWLRSASGQDTRPLRFLLSLRLLQVLRSCVWILPEETMSSPSGASHLGKLPDDTHLRSAFIARRKNREEEEKHAYRRNAF